MRSGLLFAFVLTAPLLAQDPPPDGPLAEIPLVMLGKGFTSSDDPKLRYVNLASQDARVLSDELPKYERSAMFGGAYAHVAAFSRGKCFMEIEGGDVEGVYKAWWNLDETAWSFAVFAVSSTTVGKPGSIYRESDVSSAPQRHIYAYQTGVDMPPHISDQVHVVRNGDAMGMTEFRGIDSYRYSELIGDGLPSQDSTFYFAVDPSKSTGGYAAFDGSSIYRIHYSGGSWSAPELWRDAGQLGISASAQIDAL